MEKAGNKEFTVFMDSKVNSLEDVINICIEQPLAGKALSKDSQDMKDIVAYIKSLGAK
jgi:cytochrome c